MSAPATKHDGLALAAKVEEYRNRANARVAEIKGAVVKWLEPRDSVADSVAITRALLDIALDRHVAVHEANGFDLIEGAYQRALKRSRGTLQ
jgi:hypothetical protein